MPERQVTSLKCPNCTFEQKEETDDFINDGFFTIVIPVGLMLDETGTISDDYSDSKEALVDAINAYANEPQTEVICSLCGVTSELGTVKQWDDVPEAPEQLRLLEV